MFDHINTATYNLKTELSFYLFNFNLLVCGENYCEKLLEKFMPWVSKLRLRRLEGK
jgi:hypothetical protein